MNRRNKEFYQIMRANHYPLEKIAKQDFNQPAHNIGIPLDIGLTTFNNRVSPNEILQTLEIIKNHMTYSEKQKFSCLVNVKSLKHIKKHPTSLTEGFDLAFNPPSKISSIFQIPLKINPNLFTNKDLNFKDENKILFFRKKTSIHYSKVSKESISELCFNILNRFLSTPNLLDLIKNNTYSLENIQSVTNNLLDANFLGKSLFTADDTMKIRGYLYDDELDEFLNIFSEKSNVFSEFTPINHLFLSLDKIMEIPFNHKDKVFQALKLEHLQFISKSLIMNGVYLSKGLANNEHEKYPLFYKTACFQHLEQYQAFFHMFTSYPILPYLSIYDSYFRKDINQTHPLLSAPFTHLKNSESNSNSLMKSNQTASKTFSLMQEQIKTIHDFCEKNPDYSNQQKQKIKDFRVKNYFFEILNPYKMIKKNKIIDSHSYKSNLSTLTDEKIKLNFLPQEQKIELSLKAFKIHHTFGTHKDCILFFNQALILASQVMQGEEIWFHFLLKYKKTSIVIKDNEPFIVFNFQTSYLTQLKDLVPLSERFFSLIQKISNDYFDDTYGLYLEKSIKMLNNPQAFHYSPSTYLDFGGTEKEQQFINSLSYHEFKDLLTPQIRDYILREKLDAHEKLLENTDTPKINIVHKRHKI